MDLERYITILKKTIQVRIMELYNMIELSSGHTNEEEGDNVTGLLREPLYTMLEDEEGYLLVIDMPGADESTVVVDALNNRIRVRCKLRKESIMTSSIDDKMVYEKTIILPEDADVSKLSYWFDNGRLYIKVPKL